METKELKITIPEGYEIDKENSSFEKIVFKKKEEDIKPRSWVEYCELQRSKHAKGYFVDSESYIHEAIWNNMTSPTMWRTVFPSKELTNASIAMAQLMSIRDSWIKDWKPVWNNKYSKHCIICLYNNIDVTLRYTVSSPLSFPTREMATDFMNCFKYLLEVAKPLI